MKKNKITKLKKKKKKKKSKISCEEVFKTGQKTGSWDGSRVVCPCARGKFTYKIFLNLWTDFVIFGKILLSLKRFSNATIIIFVLYCIVFYCIVLYFLVLLRIFFQVFSAFKTFLKFLEI